MMSSSSVSGTKDSSEANNDDAGAGLESSEFEPGATLSSEDSGGGRSLRAFSSESDIDDEENEYNYDRNYDVLKTMKHETHNEGSGGIRRR
ncbi:hypothetical protein Leryth_011992 [Lithospermum erythrorhizon]|nr:hypothetical protein Leryth_011992 [Lithospermum erythrorhizon]